MASESDGGLISEELTVITADLDDESPQVLGAIIDRLLSAGALDAHLTPLVMKKNRPGHRIEVLCRPGEKERHLLRMVLLETSTLGAKTHKVMRYALPRSFHKVQVLDYSIAVKAGYLDGICIKATPEFEDCRAAAESMGLPLRTVMELARAEAVGLLGTSEAKESASDESANPSPATPGEIGQPSVES